MKSKFLIYISAAAAMILSAVSCTYPFHIKPGTADSRLVVEGDVLIGEQFDITISYLSSLSDMKKDNTAVPEAKVWIEDDNSIIYNPIKTDEEACVFSFDLTEASPDVQYRLRIINYDNDHEYATDWSTVCKAPTIDALSYIPDPEKKKMNIALSMHSLGDSHFRWTYTEHWEYHTHYYALFYYVPPKRYTNTWNDGCGVVREFKNGENVYYCWGENKSSEIMVFSTENQTDDRFVDLEFHSIPQGSKKLQVLYYIEVKLEAISENCYKYWNNLLNNSDYQGSIFAPNPSEMVGNIHCLTDDKELVAGYINFAQTASSNLYIDNKITHFYNPSSSPTIPTPTIIEKKDWYYYYNIMGWVPVSLEMLEMSDVQDTAWVEKFCADCRYDGGTKNKPAFWPTPEI